VLIRRIRVLFTRFVLGYRVLVAWTRELPSPPLGLSLARETGAAVVFDAERTFTRLDAAGEVALRRPSPATVTAAAASDDGRFVAALGRRGQAWLLSAEFDVVWQLGLAPRPLAVAIDHEGHAIAVADEAGGLLVYDRHGQQLWRVLTPRPLVRLAFVPEGGELVGAADLGLVCAFDRRGRPLWRQGLAANVGSLAVSGEGGRILLACFSDGLRVASLRAHAFETLGQAAPCRIAALSYRGDAILCAGTDLRVTLHDGRGVKRDEWAPPAAPLALALSALAERAAVATERAVIGLDLSRSG
jgi:hypothetical protein